MSILSVERKYGTRRASGELGGRRQYKEIWVVIADAPTSFKMIDEHPSLPAASGAYISDAGALHDRREFEETDASGPGRYVYLVTCHYNTSQGGAEQTSRDLLSRPPRYATSYQPYQTYRTKDLDGKLFVNSAQQPYDDSDRVIDQSRLILTVNRVEAEMPVQDGANFMDTVNDGEFTVGGKTIGDGWAKMANIHSQDFWHDGHQYWNVTYEIHIDKKGWIRDLIDKGTFYYKDDEGGNPDVGNDGKKVVEDHELLLDGAGGKLSKQDIVDGNGWAFDFRVYETADFTKLNL